APVIGADGTIYVAASLGRTYAISPQGTLLWMHESPDMQPISTVTIGVDGTLYLAAYNSTLHAISPQDGSALWSVPAYGTSYTPAVAADGTIYVTTWGGALTAFSPLGEQ